MSNCSEIITFKFYAQLTLHELARSNRGSQHFKVRRARFVVHSNRPVARGAIGFCNPRKKMRKNLGHLYSNLCYNFELKPDFEAASGQLG